MAELKVHDWKPKTGASYQYAKVKKGHNLYGEIRKYPNGLMIYWAFRKPDEVFLELDAWAIDVETLRMLKMKRVPYVGIEVTNGDRYLTRIEHFEDKELGATVLNYSNHVGMRGKFGALQWYLPRYAFAKMPAPPEEAIEAMMIRGRR